MVRWSAELPTRTHLGAIWLVLNWHEKWFWLPRRFQLHPKCPPWICSYRRQWFSLQCDASFTSTLISSTLVLSTLPHISDHWTLTSISIHGNWLTYISSSIVITVNCVDPKAHVVSLIRRHRWAKECNTNRNQISVSIDQCISSSPWSMSVMCIKNHYDRYE